MKEFAILFDMDGVIVDSNPAHTVALQIFCKKYGYQLSEEELKTKIYGRTNRDWISNLFTNSLTPEQVKQYADEKEALYREIYETDIKPVDGLVDFLKLLEGNSIPKAIATSAPAENVTFTLDKTSLTGYFKTILDESFVSIGKPHPDIYLKSAEALNYPPSKCIVFEDSLAGIKAGKAAGCKVVGVLTTHTAEELAETDLTIFDFKELTLEQLESLFDQNGNVEF